MKTIIVWFRRDLRLADNPALHHALEQADRIVPVYVHAPEREGAWAPGAASRWWLHHSLSALDAELRRLGAPLVIRVGDPARELVKLARETAADSVFWNRLYEPAIAAADARLIDQLPDAGLAVETFNAALIAEPWTLKTGSGGPYRVYTPFARSLRAAIGRRALLPAPERIEGVAAKGIKLESLHLLPRIRWDRGMAQTWTPGEAGAHAHLQRFCDEAIQAYAQGRDRPDQLLTSQLSPHLHFGEIGPVQVLARVAGETAQRHETGVQGGAEVYEREIFWREFAHHVLHHFPQTPDQPMDPRYAQFPWRKPKEYADDMRRWQRGATGLPIVDAGMRQLWTSGWMHNRVRMIVASYLTKNLLIPWQEGARWFWDTLVDADLANNTLGWQWVAGSGADAAPYFRVFNPVLQSEKFDPEARYLRHWVPEIAGLPDKLVHAPWESPSGIDDAYPGPSIDLGESRRRALAAFAKIK